MACPIVAGVAAQYLEYNTSLTHYDITNVIYRSRIRGVSNLPPPLIQVPSQLDILLLNKTLTSYFAQPLILATQVSRCKMLRYFGRCLCVMPQHPSCSAPPKGVM